ncbi:hypothetical protein [Capnocytophaga canimorsus]|uniref:hypothetical protein n=1 Tax=Capnocytophaga canimorsus TaxID=28188 RepID=UPI001AD004AC|nr:hypothetical protein [Capnocytophaga canimorsus]GIM57483.1 hypothetical protein CAPN006_18750 [Capnocytophaga canimorsus]
MSSIQFNYFADEKGEEIIRQELLNKFGSLYVRDYFGKNESVVGKIEEFPKIPFEIYLTAEKLATQINTLSGKSSISIYDSPVIEYFPSGMKDDKYYRGRLAYFGANEFPEFKKDVQSLFRKLKKQCWKDAHWKVWVFETIGDEATVFIPNRVVHLKKG